jgi:PPK2 family polyphosphate:nucleotide phosphotransferase
LKVDLDDFRVKVGRRIGLGSWPTRVKDFYRSASDYRRLLERQVEDLSRLQDLLYASGTWSLLLVLQGMDAAGKDGIVKHVMSGVNPQGCEVHSFKQPSTADLKHDFLWRAVARLPERGRIGIFNRSHYEDVIVVRVHPALLQAQGLPGAPAGGKGFWKARYRSILDLEDHLQRNGTAVVKVFLHLSREEQRERLVARIDDPTRNWKFSAADLKERKLWKDYQEAYGACLGATSTRTAPWYVVPADDKKNARLIVSRILLETLEGLGLERPEVDPARRRELALLRRQLR